MIAMRDESNESHLLRLPIEIIELIAEWIPPSSRALLHLRTMNKELNEKTEHIVKTRYFEDRTFMISYWQSLHTLLQISKHPVFAKSMKRIVFSLLTLPSSETDFSSRRDSIAVEGSTPAQRREQRRKQREGRRAFERLLKEQMTMQNEGTDQTYIEQILTNFMSVGNFPAIVTNSQPGWGYSHYEGELGYDNCCIIDPQDDGPYRILNAALCLTDYPITHLEMGVFEFGVTLNIFHFRGNDPYLTLRTLRLVIGRGQTYKDESDGERTKRVVGDFIAFVQWLVVDAPNLETLILACEDRPSPFLRRDLVFLALYAAATLREEPRQGLRKLRELDLEGLIVKFDQLLDFVKETSSTLSRLILREIVDRSGAPVDAYDRIRQAHGNDMFELEMRDCFGSSKRLAFIS